MDENSWLFDILDPKILGEIGPKKVFDISADAIRNKLKDENVENLLKCALCPNMCEFSCPVLREGGRETISPARKSKLGYLYSRKKLEADELGDNPYYCVSCSACEHNCPMDLNVSDLLVPVREGINAQEVTPEGVVDVKSNLEDTETIYEEMEDEAKKGREVGDGNTLYFRSCVARKESPEIVNATFNIIEEVEGNVKTLEEEVCCGSPALSLGFKEEFSRLAEKVQKALNDSGAEKIVCSCPTCTKTLRETYADEGYEIEPEILHISEYLSENLEEMDLELEDSTEVTYHDPCTLARDLEVIDEPRKILEEIDNLAVKEPYFSKKDTRCCGRGGALSYVDEELSEEIAEERIDHLEDWSDTIITSCQSCKVSFEDAGKEEVYDLAEIVSRALE